MTPTIHPRDLNLPSKYASWRAGQYSSLMSIVDAFDFRRFCATNDPTGSGKSAKPIALASLLGGRTVILTSTKPLQSQYLNDFGSCGITDIRGRVNYTCASYDNCAEGRLFGCTAHRDNDCPYVEALNHFLRSPLGITNYSYHLSSHIHAEGTGDIGLLALDEAHNAVSELCDALEIHLRHSANTQFYVGTIPQPPIGQGALQPWIDWASASLPSMQRCCQQLKSSRSRQASQAETLLQDLTRIATLPETWIVDESTPGQTVLAPLWPTEYAHKYLFGKAEKVLLMSATIVPKTLALLNVPESDSLFLSSAYVFDQRRSPIYLFGADRIDHKTTDAQFAQLIGRMDTLISRRLDRKGIIHSVSYDRQQFIRRYSEHSSLMLTPNSHQLASAIETFRNSPPPMILVSPAITTGYDFPGTDAEYQFIIKVPFLDLRGPVMSARNSDDPEYAMYLTVQTLVQMCGRLMRGPDDSSETFILDKHINWLVSRNGKYRHLFPSWFLNLLQWPKTQPQPPVKLAVQS